MAVIEPVPTDAGRNTKRVVWANITNGDTCTAMPFPHARDKTAQAKGTFGGAALTIEGSLDADIAGTYAGLTDPQGTAISFAAAGIEALLENVYWVKPVLTGGTGSSITVTMLMGVTV